MSSSSSSSSSSSTVDVDVESQKNTPHVNHLKLVASQAFVTKEVLEYKYAGSGTEEDPYLVEFLHNDPRNPMRWPTWKKWFVTLTVAVATLAVAFVSSAYSGGIVQIMEQFDISSEVATLGISLFVLGFAIGPLMWAPLSEMYGRQKLFFYTYALLTAFNAGAAGAQNAETLIILRFLAGAFGSSPLTNAGGVIADLFPANERGLAMSLFSAAPFMGPVLGPIVGGFVGESIGWRWVEGIMAIFTGVLWIVGTAVVPETYAPVLLRQRAAVLSKKTGKVYISRLDAQRGPKSIKNEFKVALSRPWVLLFQEPIVLLLSIYMAIIYGTLYMLFAAFPICFEEARGWSQGISGLAFIGIAVGMLGAIIFNIPANKRYAKIADASPNGMAPPEARLPPTIVGSIAIPVGMFWFAWTNYPSIHWIVSIIGTVSFGFGVVLVFLSIMNYLIDSYTVYAASVLAANSVLRSLFGAAFPLFTTYMYQNLGIHWASSIPAFLALACVPFPFLFYKYGAGIREKCKYAAQAAEFMRRMMEQSEEPAEPETLEKEPTNELQRTAINEPADLPEKAQPNEGDGNESVQIGSLKEEKTPLDEKSIDSTALGEKAATTIGRQDEENTRK
ncbi:MAG: hypothetical protein M1834_004386 [Cirrosporium novae-zelandiae]|nr:MAG: hypothetical protein M1834_004386 [Cirrosporium novae-zelandiae]